MKIKQTLGYFPKDGKLRWKMDKNIFRRRSNLHGMAIKAITLPDTAKWMDFESNWDKMAKTTDVIMWFERAYSSNPH